jgi:hypothetical protein
MFQPQSSIGAEKLAALGIGGNTIYLQRASKAVRVFGYQYNVDKYVAEDMTVMARHILRDTSITSWAYQQEPFSILWCVTSDGKLAAMTVLQEQEVMGWHRHETQGTFLDVCSIPGTPDDQVWFLVQRKGGVYIERLENFFNSGELVDAFFLDSALTYDGSGASNFTGLGHLAGQAVQVFADGSSYDLTVASDGTLPLPDKVQHAVIGLGYTSTLIPTMAEIQDNQINSMMHDRHILHGRFRVINSMTFEAGIDVLHNVIDRFVESRKFDIAPFWSESTDLDLVISSGWKPSYNLIIQVTTPTPLTLLAVCLAMDVSQYSGRAK